MYENAPFWCFSTFRARALKKWPVFGAPLGTKTITRGGLLEGGGLPPLRCEFLRFLPPNSALWCILETYFAILHGQICILMRRIRSVASILGTGIPAVPPPQHYFRHSSPSNWPRNAFEVSIVLNFSRQIHIWCQNGKISNRRRTFWSFCAILRGFFELESVFFPVECPKVIGICAAMSSTLVSNFVMIRP